MNLKQLNEAFDRLAKQSLNENLDQMKAMVKDDTVDPYDLYDELITYTNDMWVNGVDALIQSTGDKNIELDGQGDVIMLSTSLGYVTWSSDDELQLLVDLVLEAESDKDVEQGVSEFLKSEYNKLAQNINEAWDEELSIKGFYNMFVPQTDPETKEKAANLLYDWYSAEGEEYMPTLSDILDMCDAADDETAKNIVLYALGQTSQSDNLEESLSDDRISGNLNLLEENKARIYNPPSRPAFPGRELASVLQNAIADAVQDYYNTQGVIPTRQEVRDAIEPFIQSLSVYEENLNNESLNSINKGTKLKEDVFYNWKPNTSFAHIKKIYNDVKKRGYKYVNNELEEMHAAMKKVDAKGYTPEQRKQIRSWSEEIWRANRKNESLKESYDDVNSNNAFDVLYDMVELFGCEEMLNALAKAIGTSDLADNLTYICRQYDYDPNPDYVDESLNEEESPESISDNDNSYPLAFVPTADVKGEDLTNTLCGVLNKAGIKNCCAKKRGGNYHITVICPSGKLATAKTIIENCGFFKEWLPLNRG